MGWNELVADIVEHGLDFFASITSSVLSWPVAFVIAVAVFYRPIRGLIGRVKTGKFAGVEFEIRDELQEAEEAARDAVREASEKKLAHSAAIGEDESPERVAETDSGTTTSPAPQVGNIDAPLPWVEFLKLWEGGKITEGSLYDPPASVRKSGEAVAAILWHFTNLEGAIRHLYELVAQVDPRRVPLSRIIGYLTKREMLNESFLESFTTLREIRNAVAHGHARPSLADARDFGRTASQLEAIVRGEIEGNPRVNTPLF